MSGFEGGAVYSAQRAGEFVLITDESTMAEFVDDEDIDLVQAGETIRVFRTAGDREAYAASRGWVRRR